METQAVNLQDKIQKLIDQYTSTKKRVEELEAKVKGLTEENMQLISQITSSNDSTAQLSQTNQLLEAKVRELEAKVAEMQSSVQGFSSIANDAIAQIDSLFPDLEEE
ncbi:MAG TPA: hypothetical protein GX398_04620 [Candidatus Cloacimonetes bacterium]|jgi:chromosome segregation ATPase|nr:hypothetical protein [Candidatus Cloacimonas sp.]HHZ15374.1 hypothetical protein [Candidatus Cloacimonadota bacterium]